MRTFMSVVLSLLIVMFAHADVLSGTLSGECIEGYLDADSFSWTVTPQLDDTWRYEYTSSSADVSHLILEVTPGALVGDFYDFEGNFDHIEVGLFGGHQGNSNPGIPDDLHGIKFEFDDPQDPVLIAFTTWRSPVWGDFYAKRGKNGAWNAGFTSGDADGPDCHVIRPNGAVPEPATFVLMAIVLMAIGLGAIVVRRRS